MYMYTYTHIHTFIHMYICIYIHMYIYMYIYSYVCICITMYICTYMCVYINIYICIYMSTWVYIYIMYVSLYIRTCICIHIYILYICIHIYIYVCTYICTYTHIYTHTYTYIYIHIHTHSHTNFLHNEKLTHMHESCHICLVQSGQDAQDPLRFRSLSAKVPLTTGLFCGKWSIKIKHSLHRRRPVRVTWLARTRANESCHAYLVHLELFLYKAKPAPVNESCHTCLVWMSHVTLLSDECVMSRRRMSHVTLINESWHPHECVTSHVSLRHITHTNESCHTYLGHYELFFYKEHPAQVNESCHTCLVRMSHVTRTSGTSSISFTKRSLHMWMSHVKPRMNESCHTTSGAFSFLKRRLLFNAEKLTYVNESCCSCLESDRFITIIRQGGRKWRSRGAEQEKCH